MSCENMDFFNNVNWQFTRFLLSCFGAWPFQTLRLRKIMRSVVFILIASIFIPEILRLVAVQKNPNLLVECAPIFALHLLTLAKMFQCLINMKKIKKLLVRIRRDWRSDLSPTETQILRSSGQHNRIITHTYIYFIYAVTVLYMSTPMIPKILDWIIPLNESRPKIALYQTEYYVDSDTYEIPILLHAYIITPFPSTVIVAFDALYANCVQHGCGMFAIVGYRLRNITHNKNRQNVWNHWRTDGNTHNYRSLTSCITKHKEVLELTILKINEPSEMIRFGIYTIGQVVHLFFLSWPSQKLIDESIKVFQSTYQSEWYTLPPKLRRHYILIMMRGCKPCKLTAGKIYTMSLQSFGQLVKTSMSYCTVLLSMQ